MMLEGTRKIEHASGSFEIVFGITGDTFQVQHIIAENPKDLDNISDTVINSAIEETEEIVGTWDSLDTDEYNSYLADKGVVIFQ